MVVASSRPPARTTTTTLVAPVRGSEAARLIGNRLDTCRQEAIRGPSTFARCPERRIASNCELRFSSTAVKPSRSYARCAGALPIRYVIWALPNPAPRPASMRRALHGLPLRPPQVWRCSPRRRAVYGHGHGHAYGGESHWDATSPPDVPIGRACSWTTNASTSTNSPWIFWCSRTPSSRSCRGGGATLQGPPRARRLDANQACPKLRRVDRRGCPLARKRARARARTRPAGRCRGSRYAHETSMITTVRP
jgi:hypothetical protein